MAEKSYYVSHSCNGITARVTVEWSWPDHFENLTERLSRAEEIADEAFGAAMFAPHKIVRTILDRKY